ncbi:MAG: PfkB family carbohydrate kinase [Chloroflexota bacterium]|nr:MAG: carbohydrate kinase family protein [Chloroflexota bacterium]
MDQAVDIIVSGHLCIDLIPGMSHVTQAAMTTPGRLNETGPMVVSTGGAVSNTGLSLFRLGEKVGLMATVGDDPVGEMIAGHLRSFHPDLTRMLRVRQGQPSSYTIVLSPQNADRTFLHCPATNDTFGADDIDFAAVARARIFHLGYPALMARLRENGGAELVRIYRQAKAAGVVTSLDMALPDAAAPSGKVNWREVIERTLPFVDVFVPSIEEILFMLRRSDYEAWKGNILNCITRDYLRSLADELLDMGAVIAGFKLGHLGLYLRGNTAEAFGRLARLQLDARAWAGADVWQPAFQVEVAGTTGAGDSAYAGLLAALLKGFGPEATARWACALGACNVERPDSHSGIRRWEEIESRMAAGWAYRPETLP